MSDFAKHTFAVGAGPVVDGKREYPDAIEITLSREKAWDLVHRLLSELQREDPSVQTLHVITFGELREGIEGE